VRLGGGVATVRQYLGARPVDELDLAMSPVLMGRGEQLLGGLDLPTLGYTCTRHLRGERVAAHLFLASRK
jgi:dihydrofolate reductase